MSERTLETDVVIVGAGPAGLIGALALADAGLTVALVAPPAPPADHRTTALLSGSVEAIDRLGAWTGIEKDAAPLRTMRLVDGTRRLVRAPEIAFHASELGLEAFGYNVANGVLTERLGAAVATRADRIARIETAATDVALTESRATVTAEDGTVVTARLAVGADGRQSMVREAAGISVKTWRYPQTALVTNLQHSQPHFDTSTEFHTETGPFTLVPLGRGRSSLVCVERPAEAERLSALDDGALGAELERRSRSILGALTPTGPRQTWPMTGLRADTLARRRAALVGEAGHAFPPIGAQGLNLGIRDVVALAELVRRARLRGDDVGGEALTARYQSARRADVATRTFGVDLLNRSLLTDFLPVQIGRTVMLQLARDVGPIRKLLMREGLRPRLFQSV
ncbi:UbiH/UbiF family hydroxylase [Chthonobacter rhizosphaerae]|uniref:UbiH/UbiF family hydroxylase n=1 Tax=Chthonobacter rhizosphaerae TaxID=2735553 RepID=UPI0015EE869F|nr:UbiH/UbiF family hydroxylase [Chthonobacter rhizosphaerae]